MKIKLCIALFVFIFHFRIDAKIIETFHFNDVLEHSTKDTLVLLDVDDTLFMPCQTIGSTVWFYSQFKKYESQGMSSDLALEKALKECEAIRHLTNVSIVEKDTDKIIDEMQKKNIPVMGIVSQGFTLATRTIEQLKTLRIDLSKSAPFQEEHYFQNEKGVLYKKGILFTCGTHKGKALCKFLDFINYHPKKIVFVNNKATHLNEVKSSIKERGIKFIGLRYGYLDENVANYRQDIADLEWSMSTFDHLMQDSEALKLLSSVSRS